MCGLLAMHSYSPQGFLAGDISNFKNMLVLTTLRGRDSTGLSGIDLTTEVPSSLVKVLGTPENLEKVNHIDLFWARAFSDYTSILGHCRAATKGRVSADNAHPFKAKHITLMHNGTLSNFEALKTKYQLEHIQTDSELVAVLFSLHPAIEILPLLEGAYAFVWFDATLKTMNFCRNFARPLWKAVTKTGSTLLLASEKATLEWNACRHTVFYDVLEEIPVHTVFTIHADSNVMKEEKYTLPVYTPPATTYRKSNYYGFLDSPYEAPARPLPMVSSEIKAGVSLVLEVLDFKYETFPIAGGGTLKTTRVELYHGYYTDNEFFGVLQGHIDKSILEAVGCKVKATVNRIIPTWKYNTTVPTVSMVDLELLNSTQNTITIPTYTGSVALIKSRVSFLLKGECDWCGAKHGATLEQASSLIYVTKDNSAKNAEGLVCLDCATANKECLIS